MTPFEIISLAFALSTVVLSVIGWLLNSLINQHKELNKSKAETSDTKFDGLITRLDDLVAQIGHLFRDQDEVNKSVDVVGVRVNTLEQNCSTYGMRCTEREKFIDDKFKVVHNRIDGIARETRMGGQRSYDPPMDRQDRDN